MYPLNYLTKIKHKKRIQHNFPNSLNSKHRINNIYKINGITLPTSLKLNIYKQQLEINWNKSKIFKAHTITEEPKTKHAFGPLECLGRSFSLESGADHRRESGADREPDQSGADQSGADRSTRPVRSRPVRSRPVRSRPIRTRPVRSRPVRSRPVRSRPIRISAGLSAGHTFSCTDTLRNTYFYKPEMSTIYKYFFQL